MAIQENTPVSDPDRMNKLRDLAQRVIQDIDYAAALHANLERMGRDASLSRAFDNTPHVKALNVIYRALLEQSVLVLMRIYDCAEDAASLPKIQRLLRDEISRQP